MYSKRRGIGLNLGSGYYNLLPLDSHIHSLSAKGIKSYSNLVQMPKSDDVMYHQGIYKNTDIELTGSRKKLSRIRAINNIKSELYNLLFEAKEYKGEKAVDNELLTIVVLKSKAHHLNFLKAHTDWNAVGFWKDELTDESYDKEKNVVIQVQFLDTKNELIGKRIKTLLERLNEYEIGEMVLYMNTVPVEETSLKLKKYRKSTLKARSKLFDKYWGDRWKLGETVLATDGDWSIGRGKIVGFKGSSKLWAIVELEEEPRDYKGYQYIKNGKPQPRKVLAYKGYTYRYNN